MMGLPDNVDWNGGTSAASPRRCLMVWPDGAPHSKHAHASRSLAKFKFNLMYESSFALEHLPGAGSAKRRCLPRRCRAEEAETKRRRRGDCARPAHVRSPHLSCISGASFASFLSGTPQSRYGCAIGLRHRKPLYSGQLNEPGSERARGSNHIVGSKYLSSWRLDCKPRGQPGRNLLGAPSLAAPFHFKLCLSLGSLHLLTFNLVLPMLILRQLASVVRAISYDRVRVCLCESCTRKAPDWKRVI